jgi:low affinity Fe/Cu permease
VRERFHHFAVKASAFAGSPLTFIVAVAVVVGWAFSGPFFGFTDTWQLVINTGTTVVTFLMVFLIQNTQNRDVRALHAKLDELIAEEKAADNAVLVAEDLSEDELKRLEQHFRELAKTGPESTPRGGGSSNADARSRPPTPRSSSR